MFCTVTATGTVSPTVTELGAVILASVISAGCGFTVTTVERWLLAALSSARLCVATRVCPPSAAAAVLHRDSPVPAAPAEIAGPVSSPKYAARRAVETTGIEAAAALKALQLSHV